MRMGASDVQPLAWTTDCSARSTAAPGYSPRSMSGKDEIEIDLPIGLGQPPAAEGLGGTNPLAGASEVASADAVGGIGELASIEGIVDDSAIAEALATGRIDASQAQALLLEQVLAEQLVGASVEELERLRETLRELLADDPLLADLLRPV